MSFAQEFVQLPGYSRVGPIYEGKKTIVYRAVETASQRSVVIKYLSQDYPSLGELLQFRNQYTITQKLSVPGIVQPLGLEPLGSRYAFIMEDVGGISLETYTQPNILTLTEGLAIALQLADILHALHQHRVIHKDINPSNILIHPESRQISLIDFSVASLLPKETQTIQSPKHLEGTLAYLAPEQTGRMNRGMDYRTDFYGLGVTLYQLLSGQRPFSSDDPLELIHCHIAQIPPPIQDINAEVPDKVAAIVAKLMAKNAEDRYQSALGLKHDLEQCLLQWTDQNAIVEFPLAQRDLSDRFLIPEKLYGRETEVQTLLEAFDRVAAGGAELMLVTGFSGIGKTAVINEVHKPIVRQRGYFIKGKFDQFNQTTPFSAFVQAFRSLMGQLLGESDYELAQWKASILAAIGDNGQVLLEVIPELEKIIGPQPAVPLLSGSAAQNRFNLLFQKFISVFTTLEHPLVIFLDDLQWVDSASLNLLTLLIGESETNYLLILGAYRDNEVFPDHPLMLTLADIKQRQAHIQSLTLWPLTEAHINRLISDTLMCSEELAFPLTKLVIQTTQGNPFFATQLLQGLYEEGCITFNPTGYWQCDLSQVRQFALTEDVVEFMVEKLQKFPAATQEVLQLAACIGNHFNLTTLAIVSNQTPMETAIALWKALQDGLIVPINNTYKFFQGNSPAPSATDIDVPYRFLHDRVQQAAYSLIPEGQKASTHHTIGQLLLEKTAKTDLGEKIFDIVRHLNIDAQRIDSSIQKAEVAQLNLYAGKKANICTAYTAAFEYLSVGISLLAEDGWQTNYDLTLELYLEATEVSYLKSDFKSMEELGHVVFHNASTLIDKILVYETKLQAYSVQHRFIDGIEIGLMCLKLLGVELSAEPTSNDVASWMTRTQDALAPFSSEELLALPEMSAPEMLAAMRILSRMIPLSYFGRPSLFPLIVCQGILLSLSYGNTSDTPVSYVNYALILCNPGIDKFAAGYQYGELATQLLEQQNNFQRRSNVLNNFYGHAAFWRQHAHECIPPLIKAYHSGLEMGDLEYSMYALINRIELFCVTGKALEQIESEAKFAVNFFTRSVQFEEAALYMSSTLQMILNLRYSSDRPWSLKGEAFDEDRDLKGLTSGQNYVGISIHYFNKLQLHYLFGRVLEATEVVTEGEGAANSTGGHVILPNFIFFATLTSLAATDCTVGIEKIEQLERAQAGINRLKLWAENAPTNYQHKYELAMAENFRLQGEMWQAAEYYDRAIEGARSNKYLQEEALANELAAKFYLDWGKGKVAAGYMQDAYYCYYHWGAQAKWIDLERHYPELLRPILQPAVRAGNLWKTSLTSTAPSTTPVDGTAHHNANINQMLDFSSAFQASQALSSTIQLDELLRQLTQVILQISGGDRCALILPRGGAQDQETPWEVRAIAQCSCREHPPSQTTTLCAETLTPQSSLPIQLIHYVKRTCQTFVLNGSVSDVENPDVPVVDHYLRQHRPKSVLCLPLMHQNTLVGIMYVENQLTQGVFTRDRLDVLTFLSTQAAISLENATLYHRLEDYNQRLEEQVTERTQALQSNNLQLQQTLQQLQQTQSHLIQSEKMSALGKMVSGIAHEINNPNNFIYGNLEYVHNCYRDLFQLIDLYERPETNTEEITAKREEIDLDFLQADMDKLFCSMKNGSYRIEEIVNGLRCFSGIDKADYKTTHLHEGLDSTLLMVEPYLSLNGGRRTIQIVKRYGDIPSIESYPSALNQAFFNIISNAIEALESAEEIFNPTITISTFHSDSQTVKIVIMDNGPGIDKSIQNQIFTPFFTTKDVGEGTGLGLAIAHQIVTDSHGGSLEVRSEVGQGSEFYIGLPI